MSESKNFIKNAVGILIVVAICLVAVTIYKKGNASINSSINTYDEIVSQFDNSKLKNYDNSTASGSQIVDLLKSLKEGDGITIQVSNGYIIRKKEDAEKYDYKAIHEEDSVIMQNITDKTCARRYINPSASFSSSVVYDENGEISSVVFKQR